MLKKILITAGILALLLVVFFVVVSKKETKIEWRTAQVEKGDLIISVTATGTVNPRQTVQVGTQVSGTVAKIYVDFNSHVKKGQVVAVLDTTFLRAAVDQAQASLDKAQTQERLALQTRTRAKALFDKGLTAQADIDQADADYETSRAALNNALAEVRRAKINLKYATIISPIDGIVINRNVDVGQTVAASLNTPTLFIIADDLSLMQVQVGVDEGDIGSVKVGQKATFTVDAYPERTFEGTVSQIRLQPTTTQNVVSYTVMLDVANEDQSLMPGMTANVTIVSQSYPDVLKVPSTALKFVPPIVKGGKFSGKKNFGKRDSTMSRGGAWGQGGGQAVGGERRFMRGKGDRQMVFVLENNMPRRIPVKVIATNGSETAVEGNLTPGQEVLIGSVGGNRQPQTNKQSGMPFGMSGRPH